MNRSRRLALTLTTLVVFGCTEGPHVPARLRKKAEGTERTIGVVTALTGPSAPYGTSMKDGIALAIAEVNAAGGVGKKKVRAIYVDGESTLDGARRAAERLVREEKVEVLLGEVSSAGAIAVAKVAERAEIPLVVPAATEPEVTAEGEHVFRIAFVDPFQAEVMARFAKDELRLDALAIAKDVDRPYSAGLARGLARAFEAKGGRVLTELHFGRDDEGFQDLVAELGKSGARAVYLPAYATEIARIARAIRAAKLDVVLLGADGFEAHQLYEDPSLLEGAFFTTHFAADDPAPEVTRFVERFRATYNETPDAIAALGYDAARVALGALARAESGGSTAVTRELAATRDFAGVTGKITFDAARNAIKPAAVLRVRDGKRALAARLDPP